MVWVPGKCQNQHFFCTAWVFHGNNFICGLKCALIHRIISYNNNFGLKHSNSWSEFSPTLNFNWEKEEHLIHLILLILLLSLWFRDDGIGLLFHGIRKMLENIAKRMKHGTFRATTIMTSYNLHLDNNSRNDGSMILSTDTLASAQHDRVQA